MIPLGVKFSSEIFWVHGSISEKIFSSRRRRMMLCIRGQHVPIPGHNWMTVRKWLTGVCTASWSKRPKLATAHLPWVYSRVRLAQSRESVSYQKPGGAQRLQVQVQLPSSSLFLAWSARCVRKAPRERVGWGQDGCFDCSGGKSLINLSSLLPPCVGLRSLRKNRKLTVITAFVPYKNRFLIVNLQYHVLMTNRLKNFSIVPMAINIPILFILGVVLYQQSCLQSKTLLLTFTFLSALVLIMRNTLY